MGAEILSYQSFQNPTWESPQISNHPTPSRLSFHPVPQANFQYLSREFPLNQQFWQFTAKQQIVQNNYSEQFDPLLTTFRPQNKTNYGKFRILCSNITNEKIQQYKISFRNQDEFRTYIVSYFWRKNCGGLNSSARGKKEEWPLVKTTNFKILQDSKDKLRGGITSIIKRGCNSNKEIFCKVYMEDVPLRLCHIKDIPFPENVYILRQCLKGFQLIYENIGYIKPFQDLICISRKGHIKVWLNSDLSKNFPNLQNIEHNRTPPNPESLLINQILTLIQSNTDPQKEPISLTQFMKQHHVSLQNIDFEKVYQMLEKYVEEVKFDVPDVFSSIVEVLNQEEEEYDTYRTEMEAGRNEQGDNSYSQKLINSRSRNNSGSGLFLDIPQRNVISSSRKRRSKQQKKTPKGKAASNIIEPSSKRQKKKSQQQQSSKRNRTQSQKNPNESLQSSLHVNSNALLSQSLPISRNLNPQQRSSNDIGNQSSNINEQPSSSQTPEGQHSKPFGRKQQQVLELSSLNKESDHNLRVSSNIGDKSSEIKKLNENCFVQVDRQLQNSQGKTLNLPQDDHNLISRSSIPFCKANPQIKANHSKGINLNSNKREQTNERSSPQNGDLGNKSSKEWIPTPPHLIPYSNESSPARNQPQNLTNKNYYTDQQNHRQNKQSHFKRQSDPYPEISLTKKTYSNLWTDKNAEIQQDQSPSSRHHTEQVQQVQATQQELQHMMEIDKYIEEEVIKEEQEEQKQNHFKQLLEVPQRKPLKKNTAIVEPTMSRSACYKLNSSHINPKVNSSHIIHNSQSHIHNPNNMNSLHNMTNQSHQSQLSSPRNITHSTINPAQQSNHTNHNSIQNPQTIASPRSNRHNTYPPINQLPNLQQPSQELIVSSRGNQNTSNVNISGVSSKNSPRAPSLAKKKSSHAENPSLGQIQLPCDSRLSRNRPNSHISIPIAQVQHQSNITHSNDSKISIPIISSRNQFVPTHHRSNPHESQHYPNQQQPYIPQLQPYPYNNSSYQPIPYSNPQPMIHSSTSIGHSIQVINQVQYLNKPPSTSNMNQPRVTFAVKTPQQHSYVNINSSTSMNPQKGLYLSQPNNNYNYQQDHPQVQPLELISYQQIPAQPVSYQQMLGQSPEQTYHRLGSHVNTIVSNYVHGINGSSSRKFLQGSSNDSVFSKPSIVEYSLLKNQELFRNQQSEHHNMNNSQTVPLNNANTQQNVSNIHIQHLPSTHLSPRNPRSRNQFSHHEVPARIPERSLENSQEKISPRAQDQYRVSFSPHLQMNHPPFAYQSNSQMLQQICPIPQQHMTDLADQINSSIQNSRNLTNTLHNNNDNWNNNQYLIQNQQQSQEQLYYQQNYNNDFWTRERYESVNIPRLDISNENSPDQDERQLYQLEKSVKHSPNMSNSKLNMTNSKVNMSVSKINMGGSKINMENSKINMGNSKVNMSGSKINMGNSKINLANSKVNTPQSNCYQENSQINENPSHQRKASGLRVVSSDNQERSFVQNSQQEYQTKEISIQQHYPYKIAQNNQIEQQNNMKQVQQPVIYQTQQPQHYNQYYISQQPSEQTSYNQPSSRNTHNFQINIRPSFCSGPSHEDSRKSLNRQNYHQMSSQGAKSVYCDDENYIKVQKEGSNEAKSSMQGQQPPSNYRFVESIEENRPNSLYQQDIQNNEDFVIHNKSSKQDPSPRVMKPMLHHQNHHYNHNHHQYNPAAYSTIYAIHAHHNMDNESHSPTQSNNASPRLHKLPNKPVTGRTMFLNNQNQLTSEMIEPESEMESQVDYTYNSYDKWKDKSRINNGPSRFRELDNHHFQNHEQETFSPQPNNFNYANHFPQRHMNHKQMIKSSIEGLNSFTNHLFNRHQKDYYNNFHTQKKQQEKPNRNNETFVNGFNRDFRPTQLKGYKLAQHFHEEELDEQILNDLKKEHH